MIRKILKSKRGMTLVEVLVSTVLVGLASVVMLLGFRAIIALRQNGESLKADENALTRQVVMQDTAQDVTSAPASIPFGKYAIPGTYKTFTVGDFSYTVFESDESAGG